MSSTRDLILKLAGGNPGALTVLCGLYELHGSIALMKVEAIEDCRGSAIREVYKEYANHKVGDFLGALDRWVEDAGRRARRAEVQDLSISSGEVRL